MEYVETWFMCHIHHGSLPHTGEKILTTDHGLLRVSGIKVYYTSKNLTLSRPSGTATFENVRTWSLVLILLSS